jgi:hypothetical protein
MYATVLRTTHCTSNYLKGVQQLNLSVMHLVTELHYTDRADAVIATVADMETTLYSTLPEVREFFNASFWFAGREKRTAASDACLASA